MKVLSLFDGMACGMIAMKSAGVNVESYDAYEIDKYAIKTAQHNFPTIEEHGDVFTADFSQYSGVDFLIGGSPCTHWSIAQTKHRETTTSGIGWDLFSQYLRALHEAEPKYFIYENNKSMASAIKEQITMEFGFEPICINSALVSAQNRQRLYWVGRRNPDGTYSQIDVEQPEDKGILMRDILETGVAWQEKAYCITATEYKGSNAKQTLEKHRRTMVAEPVGGGLGAKTGLYATPVNTTVDGKAQCLRATYYKDGIRNMVGNTIDRKTCVAVPLRIREATKQGYVDIAPGECVDLAMPGSKTRCGRAMREKSNCLTTSCEFYEYCGTLDMPIYQVRDGRITIKGKEYPIKLRDGCYIIRKLTVTECKRLQTVPDDYEFPVSNTQAYKMLGNGWTCEVIAHLIKSAID